MSDLQTFEELNRGAPEEVQFNDRVRVACGTARSEILPRARLDLRLAPLPSLTLVRGLAEGRRAGGSGLADNRERGSWRQYARGAAGASVESMAPARVAANGSL